MNTNTTEEMSRPESHVWPDMPEFKSEAKQRLLVVVPELVDGRDWTPEELEKVVTANRGWFGAGDDIEVVVMLDESLEVIHRSGGGV